MDISACSAKRLVVKAAAAAAAAIAVLALIIPARAASTARVRAATSIPKCTANDLGVWVAADQIGAAGGTAYMQLEFTNLSHSACTLYGFPGVSAVAITGQELGSPAIWDHAVPPTTVRVAPGGSAHALLEYVDVVTGECPSAYRRTASDLRVFSPGQDRANRALWDFLTCTAKGSTRFLLVRVIAPGLGVLGDVG